MILEVYRGVGDRAGTPIIDPLLSDSVLQVRGRAEMNAHAHQLNQVDVDVVPRVGVRLGQLLSMQDVTSSVPVVAKIVGMSIRISRGNGIDMRLSVEQPV